MIQHCHNDWLHNNYSYLIYVEEEVWLWNPSSELMARKSNLMTVVNLALFDCFTICGRNVRILPVSNYHWIVWVISEQLRTEFYVYGNIPRSGKTKNITVFLLQESEVLKRKRRLHTVFTWHLTYSKGATSIYTCFHPIVELLHRARLCDSRPYRIFFTMDYFFFTNLPTPWEQGSNFIYVPSPVLRISISETGKVLNTFC